MGFRLRIGCAKVGTWWLVVKVRAGTHVLDLEVSPQRLNWFSVIANRA